MWQAAYGIHGRKPHALRQMLFPDNIRAKERVIPDAMLGYSTLSGWAREAQTR
jgi:hypothetical protein